MTSTDAEQVEREHEEVRIAGGSEVLRQCVGTNARLKVNDESARQAWALH
jgi:hypothetical protein